MQAVAAHRDVKAYELLFRHYGPRVRVYLSRFTNDPALAEELMQETMTTVWRKAPQYDQSRGGVSAWIFTIARNKRIDALRRDRRPELDPDDPALAPEAERDPEAALALDQEAVRLRQELARLPAEQGALLELAYFQDQSHAMIAERLNLPLGTVKSRIRLAFVRLRAALGDGLAAKRRDGDKGGEP